LPPPRYCWSLTNNLFLDASLKKKPDASRVFCFIGV
jgi:hypothetical protein